jgi:hypothetical protein
MEVAVRSFETSVPIYMNVHGVMFQNTWILLILTSFYLLIVGVKGYCCVWSHSTTHTFGRIPLDEGSARHRDLYLTTHNTHKRLTFMPPGGIRTHNPSKRAAADRRLRPRGHRDRGNVPCLWMALVWFRCSVLCVNCCLLTVLGTDCTVLCPDLLRLLDSVSNSPVFVSRHHHHYIIIGIVMYCAVLK